MAKLARFQRYLTDAAGNVQPNEPAEVRNEATGNLASLFSDRAGMNAIVNATESDANGMLAFHVVGGVYKISSPTGAFEPFRYVAIGTAAESDLLTGSLAFNASGAFADRGDYDDEDSPDADGNLFVYLSEDGDGGSITDAVAFAKRSNASADWSDPILLRGPAGGTRYEIGNWDSDRPATGEELLSWVMTQGVTYPAGFTHSKAKARVASTGTAVYPVQKNDVQIGTITFAASVTGVFALAADTSFAEGDRLTVIAPSPRDATLSGVVITLVGSADL